MVLNEGSSCAPYLNLPETNKISMASNLLLMDKIGALQPSHPEQVDKIPYSILFANVAYSLPGHVLLVVVWVSTMALAGISLSKPLP